LLDAAEFAHSGAPSLLRSHSCGEIFLDLAVDVKTQLRPEFLFNSLPSQK
jgi:hypothetical protein